ncbi:SF1B family DNA helicase RecD2 [Mesoplasma corruscae]|uniref:Exodeoxyribonuclease V subunit alpha n=1 Tax=Mesoplasma corruscae TaxID=216874 RepID=A0A2S5RES2_9MOLU|nr:AAA family ATPase [Mesoplasma corruscae]PPE05635.1 exodeoxyribonuclease V subunit alpha [Mesoplasma corruscae]
MLKSKTYRGYLIKNGVSNDSGWGTGIFSMEDNEKNQLSIKGIIGSMTKKTLYEITGEFEEHPRYGRSFKVTSFRKAPIHSTKDQINFLSGPSFPGIGKKTAETIVNFFKEDAIVKLSENLDILDQIPDLPKSFIPVIINGIKDNIEKEGQQRLRYIFFENGLKTSILDWMENKFENDNQTIQNYFENNFLSYTYQKNIASFDDLDKVAVWFGLDLHSDERIGYWAWKLTNEILFDKGDSYTDKNVLSRLLIKKLNILEPDLIMKGFLFAKKEGILIFEDNKIYTKESYEEEIVIAEKSLAFCKLKSKLVNQNKLDFEISLIAQEIAYENNIQDFKFDDIQIQALKTFANNRLLILTGGPGTGKTTLIKAMVKLFYRLNNSNNFAIATPTGRAASRIRETFKNSNATTIHKLLQAKDTNEFQINENNPLKEQLIIIDECSMVDSWLFSNLLKACDNVEKIVFVGDANQLPSVGYGNVFKDMIHSKTISTIFLNQIHRQKNKSEIIDIAYKTLAKTLELSDIIDKTNIFSQLDKTNEEVLNQITEIVKNNWDDLKTKQNFLQIICPMYGGNLGIDEINAEIQYKFNKNINDQTKIFQRGDYRFVVDDKIMFLRNEPDYDLSNGDVGKIVAFQYNAYKRLKAVVCEFNEKEIVIKPSDFIDVKLAYATSVHKTQGSEYQNVVLVLDNNAYNSIFLTNSLIYTAITRTKENLHIFSSSHTLFDAIEKDERLRQTTLVNKLLTMKLFK